MAKSKKIFGVICHDLCIRKKRPEEVSKKDSSESSNTALAQEVILLHTGGDYDRIKDVKAEASSGTAFELVNSCIGMMALAASAFSVLRSSLGNSKSDDLIGMLIVIALFGVMMYGLIIMGVWRDKIEWRSYVEIAAQHLLDEMADDSNEHIVNLLEAMNENLTQLVNQKSAENRVNHDKKTKKKRKSEQLKVHM